MYKNIKLSRELREEVTLSAFEGLLYLKAIAEDEYDRQGINDLGACWFEQVSNPNGDNEQTIRALFNDAIINKRLSLLTLASLMLSRLIDNGEMQPVLVEHDSLGEIPSGVSEDLAVCLMLLLHPPTTKILEGFTEFKKAYFDK